MNENPTLSDDLALLRQYTDARDAESFALLIRRHTSLVYGTCLRMLRNTHDAEDVSQECFLELARRPDAIARSLPGWLHTLATNRSKNLIRNAATRREHETAAITTAIAGTEPTWDAVAPQVDEALEGLPEELRQPLILHYLQGKSQAETAEVLGINQSTVSRRLESGVEELRTRLKKAGIVASAALIAHLLASNASAVEVPAALAASLGKMALVGAGNGGGTVATGGGLLSAPVAKFAAVAVVGIALTGAFVLVDRRTEAQRSRIRTGETVDSRLAKVITNRPLGSTEATMTTDPTTTILLGQGAEMKFARIPGGTFRMGSPANEKERGPDEGPQHDITIGHAFYMGTYPVTRREFAAFVAETGYKTDAEKEGWAYGKPGDNWGKVNGATWRAPGFEQTDAHPVVCVSWNDAVAFCQWLSAKSSRVIRLPTEAEWEYACRAGTQTAYLWGDDATGGDGWLNAEDGVEGWEDGFVFTSPVGSFKPNGFGLYDMLGNVWNACADWYGAYDTTATTDPKGQATGTSRVARGGTWDYPPRLCRCAWRLACDQNGRSWDFGFRVVLDDAR